MSIDADSENRVETIHEASENVDDFEGTGDEVLDFAATRIDDFFPRLECHRLECESAETIDHRPMCIEVTFEAFESCRSPRSIGVFAPDPFDVLGCQRNDESGGLDVVLLDLLAPMRRRGKADARQSLACPPADGLTIHGQGSGGHHVQIRPPRTEKSACHDGPSSVSRADHET